MFVIEFFNSIAEYLMLYILGCIFADVSLRNIRKNVVLILIFSFMQMDLTMFTTELQVLYNVSVTVSYFVYIVLQFLFFAAVFYGLCRTADYPQYSSDVIWRNEILAARLF